MKQLLFLTGIAGLYYSFKKDQIAIVPDEWAAEFLRGKIAVEYPIGKTEGPPTRSYERVNKRKRANRQTRDTNN